MGDGFLELHQNIHILASALSLTSPHLGVSFPICKTRAQAFENRDLRGTS